MPFDVNFLQYFSNLQVEVAELQGGYNGMRHDLHRMSSCIESIEERLTYFKGYVE